MNPILEIKGLEKQFLKNKHKALDTITLSIDKPQIIGLIGPDGAGKTTLLRLIAGLLSPSKGSISIYGMNSLTEASNIHEIIGYMPQQFGLYEDLSVERNLNLYADLRGLPSLEKEVKYKTLLSFTGLGPFKTRLCSALSGGMKQKLGLACALICKPKILLLDEPSVGVDPLSRRELWSMVTQLIDDGVLVIWSTSYLEEAEKCHTVLLLNEGKLLFNGPPTLLTKEIEGRIFRIENSTTRKRALLLHALNDPHITDGVIQGNCVRVTFKSKENINFSIKELVEDKNTRMTVTTPRFEDAFIDILGGGPGGYSELAKITQPRPIDNQPIIEAKSLTKTFGTFTAAQEISFSVFPGEIFGLLGPNGAGKSTTFKMLCGLLKPTKGEAFVNGVNLSSSLARSHIGYMAQKFSLYGNLSVLQNLSFFAGIYNLKGDKKKNAIEEMILTFGLKPYLDFSAHALSLGFKQRLALGCSVMHSPSILFLDEPTSGVDPITRREFWNHINGMVEKGITIMVTTHFMDEAEYCDRIALIYQSKMIQMNSPDGLKELSKTPLNQNPSLEEAFIELIERYNKNSTI